MNPKTDSLAKKPRLALWLATGFGLGYLPLAPGTWGSVGGVMLGTCRWWLPIILLGPERWAGFGVGPLVFLGRRLDPFIFWQFLLAIATAVVGVCSAGRVEAYVGTKDPQFVVIDEICGQQIALLAGSSASPLPNWKYLLLGLILFRVFDIWKPFPARQAESLPGGWGIMADDWVAGVYGAMLLWVARYLGL